MRTVTWTPDPDTAAEAIVFRDDRGPWVLVDVQGIEGNQAAPTGVGAPRQMGQTVAGVAVSPREIVLTLGLVAETKADLVEMRRSLEWTMTDEPPVFGQPPRLGSLRFADVDEGQFDIDGLPRGGLQFVSRDPTGTMEVYDVTVWCPDPRFKAPADVQYDFSQTDPGGLEFPITLPLEIDAGTVEAVVVNQGTVSTPIVVRLYGESTNPRVVQTSTGEVLQFQGDVGPDEYVEIDTGFGTKRVEVVTISTGERVDALERLDMTVSSFWSLRPGPQSVRYEADANVDGYAVLYFRPRFMGV